MKKMHWICRWFDHSWKTNFCSGGSYERCRICYQDMGSEDHPNMFGRWIEPVIVIAMLVFFVTQFVRVIFN